MDLSLSSRFKNAWNAFRNRAPTMMSQNIGSGYSYRPDRFRLTRGNERSIVTSVYNRIALDVAAINIQHVQLDDEGRFLNVIKSGLNECLSLEANLDQTGMLNYYNRTIEPIISAIVDEMKRKFLTKTARSQNKSIMFFRDPFKLVPVADLAEISDKFTRNEIATSNEIRQVIGWKPSADPKADELRNSNLSEPGGSVTDATSGDGTESSDTSDYDALVNEVLDSISAQIDDIVGNYTSGDDKEGDDS